MNEFFRESFLESNLTQRIPEKIKDIETMKMIKNKYKNMNCSYCMKGINNNIISQNEKINNEKGQNKEINIININNNKTKQISIEDYPIASYYKNLSKYKSLSYDIYINEKVYSKLYMHPGRILKVRSEMLKHNKKSKKKGGQKIDDGIYVVLIQAYHQNYYGSIWCLGISKINKDKKICKNTSDLVTKRGRIKNYSFFYKEYDTNDIIEAYENPFNIKFKSKKDDNIWKVDKNDFFYIINPGVLVETLKELERISSKHEISQLKEEINFIPIDLKKIVKDLDFQQKVDERQKILEDSKNNICLKCPNFYEHYKQYNSYKEACDKIEELEGQLNPENLEHYKEFKTRHNILQDLDYVNEDNSLTLKGKAAREIGTTDCVLITELLTSDILNSLSDSEVVGFISGFASNKNIIELEIPFINKNFSNQVKKFTKIYEKLYEKEKSYNFEENKYNRRMTFEFSNAMKRWMEGEEFLTVLDSTELEEGKLYNLIMRIFLMLEEISNFYSMMGNVGQSKRFLEIKEKLMRGIMAMQSLYLQEKIDIDSIAKKNNE